MKLRRAGGNPVERQRPLAPRDPSPPRGHAREERTRLCPLPQEPFAVAFGETRRFCWDSTISVDGVRYSVPHQLGDSRVWARFHGDEPIVTAVGEHGPAEVARHPHSTPGNPQVRDERYPHRHTESE